LDREGKNCFIDQMEASDECLQVIFFMKRFDVRRLAGPDDRRATSVLGFSLASRQQQMF